MDSYQKATLDHPRLWALWQQMVPNPAAEIASMLGFEALLKRYQEPHRAYHAIDHLYDLAEQFEKHKDAFGADRTAVIAALFFHDAIYNCRPGDDETQSAELAHRILPNLELAQRDVKRACDIILMTAKHAAANGDHAAQLFLDMDMSILAANPERYAQYAQGVMREFTHERYTEAEFCLGRQVFLQHTLQQSGPIFKTAEYASLDEAAKRNMRDEIARLNARKTQLDITKPKP